MHPEPSRGAAAVPTPVLIPGITKTAEASPTRAA